MSKKITLILLITSFANAAAQIPSGLTSIKTTIEELNNEVNTDSGKIVSDRGLNVFFAKQVSAYLSSASDLSLYSAYAVVNQADKRLFIGKNIANDPSKSRERTSSIITIGLNAAYVDDFSNLYEGNRLANDIGVTMRITLLGRGVVSFDHEHQWSEKATLLTTQEYKHRQRINFQRGRYKKEDSVAFVKKAIDFEAGIARVSDPDYADELRKDYYKKTNASIVSDYLKKEAALLEQPRSHHWYWTHWVTLDAYIPVTETKYLVAPSVLSTFDTANLVASRFSLVYSNLFEGRYGRLLASAGFGLRNNNGILTKDFKKYSLAQYRDLGGTDTVSLVQLNAKEIYIGDYETFLSQFTRVQIVFFPKIQQKALIGISAMIEKFYGTYNPTNIRVGVPIIVNGKDEKPVTFEIQGKWDDYFGEIVDVSPKKKFTVGVTIGIPLTSKMY